MTAPRLIGIFGTGRNGSTLLTRLLDGIDGVYVHPVESNVLCAMNDLAPLPVVRRRTIQNAVDAPLRRLHRRIPMRRLLSFYDQHCREIEQDYIPLVAPIGARPPETWERGRVRERTSPFAYAFLRLVNFPRYGILNPMGFVYGDRLGKAIHLGAYALDRLYGILPAFGKRISLMSRKNRRFIAEYYRDDNRVVAELVKKDLAVLGYPMR